MLISEQDYLEHYGITGMKWYQHLFGKVDGRAKYMHKGFGKLRKAKAKVETGKIASDKAKTDYVWNQYFAESKLKGANAIKAKTKGSFRWYPKSAKKLEKSADKDIAKAEKAWKNVKIADKQVKKYTNVGQRVAKKMNDIFGWINMSELDNEEISLGRQFSLLLFDDRRKG